MMIPVLASEIVTEVSPDGTADINGNSLDFQEETSAPIPESFSFDAETTAKAQRFYEEALAAIKSRDEFYKQTQEELEDMADIPQETQKAISERNHAINDLYRKAASLGHLEAMYQLASMMRAAAEQFKTAELRKIEAELRELEGKGQVMRRKTLKQELKLFSALGTSTTAFDKAAEEAGHLQVIGLAREVQIGFDEGLQWMKRAAHMKHVKAMYEAGMLYLDAEGPFEHNVDKGQEFIKLAAAKNHIRAPTTLAILYTEGQKVDSKDSDGPWLVEPNPKLALKYLKQGVRQKVPQAMHMLAESYCQGRAVKRNSTRCFKLMRKAAKRGHVVAQHDVAVMYHDGKGTEKDQDLFLQYLRKSAEKKHAPALYRLGMCYHKAIVVEEDKDEAFKWFKEAADLGHEDGCHAVALYYMEQKRYKRAKLYFEEAARQGHPLALFNLAEMYFNGLGMPAPSRAKAIELFKMGHRDSHLPSKRRLLDLGVDPDEPPKPSVWE